MRYRPSGSTTSAARMETQHKACVPCGWHTMKGARRSTKHMNAPCCWWFMGCDLCNMQAALIHEHVTVLGG
eukprot:1136938-Pelagomonas_calceolata.AAC.3